MNLKAGDKVHYVLGVGPPENGVVKSIQDEEHVFVVYRCNNDWEHSSYYTAARTEVKDLREGWV